MKTCNFCKRALPLTDFAKDQRSPDGCQYRCRSCQREYDQRPEYKARRAAYMRERRKDPKFVEHLKVLEQAPHRRRSKRAYQLARYYGLSEEDLARLYDAQGRKCGGCGKGIGLTGKDVHVDHCHSTGRVRGLLCQGCNIALGAAKDSHETLHNLAHYLAAAERITWTVEKGGPK